MPHRSRRAQRSGSRPPKGHTTLNLRTWSRTAAGYERRHRRSLAAHGGKAWGTFRIPESQLHLLGPVRGRRVLELGCGAADWSIALARSGARVVGLDFSRARLRQARRSVERAGVRVALLEASAESLPFPAGRFDLVLSDYGATTFTDPSRTIAEAGRVLRSGGLFVFAHASPFRSLVEDLRAARLRRHFVRDYFALGVLRTPDSIEFQRPYGGWIDLFSSCDLQVDRLIEPQAPRSPRSTYFSPREQQWARHWPVESIWRLVKAPRRRGASPRPRTV
jgi:ubiquinone/menaquinone biosynthesis C-methylase UbiE